MNMLCSMKGLNIIDKLMKYTCSHGNIKRIQQKIGNYQWQTFQVTAGNTEKASRGWGGDHRLGLKLV